MPGDIANIRERPGLFIGSTDSRGALHLAYELICVDQFLAGKANWIRRCNISVQDNGEGFPPADSSCR